MENYQEFKVKLESMRSNIISRLEKINQNKTRQGGPLEADSEEQAVSLQSKDVVDQLDELERREILQIDAALGRISDGTFGVCTSCGEGISEKRLNALPFATICMNCVDEA